MRSRYQTIVGLHGGVVALCIALGMLTLAPDAVAGPRIIDDGESETSPGGGEPAGEATGEGDAPTTPRTDAPSRPGPKSEPVSSVDPTAERHDGFHLRILAGADLWFSSQDDFGTEASVVAAGVPILTGGLEVGYAFVENLIGFVEVMFNGGPVISATVDDVDFDDEGSFFGIGLGLGATYYIMPSNLYVAASAGTSWLAFTDDEPPGASGATENGFYVAAKVGLEWWIGAQWAMGIAGRAVYMTLPDDESTVNSFGFGAFFSTTYN